MLEDPVGILAVLTRLDTVLALPFDAFNAVVYLLEVWRGWITSVSRGETALRLSFVSPLLGGLIWMGRGFMSQLRALLSAQVAIVSALALMTNGLAKNLQRGGMAVTLAGVLCCLRRLGAVSGA